MYFIRLISFVFVTSAMFAQSPNFAAPVTLPGQQGSLAVVNADFNSDGSLDIAIANASSSTVSVYLNNGSGAFTSAATLTEPDLCEGANLAAASFSGGSGPDIAVFCPLGGIAIFPNTGKGTFGSPISVSVPEGAWVGNLLLGSIHATVADFNGDGHPDIALPVFEQSNFEGTFYLLLASGNSAFQTPQLLPFSPVVPTSIIAGDFNGDKKIDLVVAGYDASNNYFLQFAPGNGDGTFGTVQSFALPNTAGSSLLVADVNGDGNLDVLLTCSSLLENVLSLEEAFVGGSTNSQGAAGVTVMLGDGTGSFKQAYNVVETSYVSGAALADTLHRGKLDLVESVISGDFLANTAPTGQVTVRLGNGDGTFGSPVALSIPSTTIPTDVMAASFTADGLTDIAIAELPSKAVAIDISSLTNFSGLLESVLPQLPTGGSDVLLNTTTVVVTPPPPPTFTDANSASFAAGSMARGSIVTAFGTNLAAATVSNNALPLPTSLGGDTISIKDASGNTTAAPLFYVSPDQINYEIPDSVALGAATITIQSGTTGFVATQEIVGVAPGIYGVDGMALGFIIQVVNGVQQVTPIVQNNALTPIDVAGGQTYLVLFGTGIHNHMNPVVATIGKTHVTAAFAGSQGQYAGEDQINIQLPAGLAGDGVIPVALTADGQTSNSLNIQIQ